MLVLLQEIQFQKADLAIADLTINTPRNDAIDFSMPFMKLGGFLETENIHLTVYQISRNLNPVCRPEESASNSDSVPQPVPPDNLDQHRGRLRLGLGHAAHRGPLHPCRVGPAGRLRPRRQPHRGRGEPSDQPLLLVGLGRCYVDGL